MSDIRKDAEACRDECERLARAAEQEMLTSGLSVEEKNSASDRARVYWQLSRNWADTVAHSIEVRPPNFTGKRKLSQVTEDARVAFLKRIYEESGENGRQGLANEAWKDEEANSLFPSYDRIYRSLSPEMFDRIRKQSNRTVLEREKL